MNKLMIGMLCTAAMAVSQMSAYVVHVNNLTPFHIKVTVKEVAGKDHSAGLNAPILAQSSGSGILGNVSYDTKSVKMPSKKVGIMGYLVNGYKYEVSLPNGQTIKAEQSFKTKGGNHRVSVVAMPIIAEKTYGLAAKVKVPVAYRVYAIANNDTKPFFICEGAVD